MFIELHILQSFAPSNLNRDDTGNPKDTEYGGVRRARISSQCIKRAIRYEPIFAQTTAVELGVRTRWMTRLLVKPLIETGKPDDQAQNVAESFAAQYCKLDGKVKDRTSVLLYLSASEIANICQALLDHWGEILETLKENKSPVLDALAKELFKNLKNRTSAPDIAMFGRMLAEKPELNIDAACQVAHAISTHRVNMEMDFYTAVDDIPRDDETGAGMMGVIPFNSACFYRYARIDWEQLVRNLNGDTPLARRTVEGFLRAAIQAVPTGKQTGFAAQNPPDFLLGIVRRDGQSWSLTNAFERPVRADRDGGLMRPSIVALDQYWGKLFKAYGDAGIQIAALSLDDSAQIGNLKDYSVSDRESWIRALMVGLPQE